MKKVSLPINIESKEMTNTIFIVVIFVIVITNVPFLSIFTLKLKFIYS